MIEVEKVISLTFIAFYIKGTNKLHRLDGPAVKWFDGTENWYIHGNNINCSSQKEFERLIKLLVFI